jgi:hypothetical protein
MRKRTRSIGKGPCRNPRSPDDSTHSTFSHRPTYPSELFGIILKYFGDPTRRDVAVDIATGSGTLGVVTAVCLQVVHTCEGDWH